MALFFYFYSLNLLLFFYIFMSYYMKILSGLFSNNYYAFLSLKLFNDVFAPFCIRNFINYRFILLSHSFNYLLLFASINSYKNEYPFVLSTIQSTLAPYLSSKSAILNPIHLFSKLLNSCNFFSVIISGV